MTSVGTKARKKQPPLSSQAADSGRKRAKIDPALQSSLMTLESACIRILESRFPASDDETDHLYWQQRFKNIATPISLAVAECRGPRHFHNHYRHRADDDSVLHPVLGDPCEMLAAVCEKALLQCQSELVGIRDNGIVKYQRLLEAALRGFLWEYQEQRDAAV